MTIAYKGSIQFHVDKFPLADLKVMQADLRHWDHMKDMVAYVKQGGFWTPEYLAEYSKEKKLPRISPVIAISRFEDGTDFLHDGHHRCVATWLGGREYLRTDEYQLTHWVYDDYLEIAPHNNWYTPFNPKTHVRTADFAKFKAEAKERFNTDPKEAVDWLFEHLDDFRTIRTIKNVPDLAALVKKTVARR
jgi:hypothetical protein